MHILRLRILVIGEMSTVNNAAPFEISFISW